MIDSPYVEIPEDFPRNFKRAMKLHATDPAFIELLNVTKMRIRRIFIQYNNRVYVAFSGGKDSTVLAHITLQQFPDAWIYNYDYGDSLVPRDVAREVVKNGWSLGVWPNRFVCRKSIRRGNIRDSPNLNIVINAVTEETEKHGWSAGLLGFRAEESCGRKWRVSHDREYSNDQHVWLHYPIRDWGWRDVYAYIISRDLKIPRLYHAYAALADSYEFVRMASFFDSEFDAIGNSNIDGHVFPGFKHWRK